MAIREADILKQLDHHAAGFSFPTLNNLHIDPVDVRLTAYRDDGRWAIAIEHIGYSNRGFTFGNVIYGYGNCLLQGPGGGPSIDLTDWDDNTW